MAYPDDEENGTSGFRKTGLAVPGSAAPPSPRPPIGAAPSAFADNTITSLLPQIAQARTQADPNFMLPSERAVYAKTGLSSGQQTGMTPGDIARYAADPATAKQLADHTSALDAAGKFLNLQTHINTQREQTQSHLDSAEFIGALSQLDHSSPDYDTQATKLFAKYPRAAGPAVEGALGLKNSARNQYLHGTAKGGAEQFAEGSAEQEAYIRRYAQTHNPLEAQAHAENTQKNEEALREHVAAGHFDPADLSWTNGKPDKPQYFTAHGNPNYAAINLAAAQKAGQLATGKLTEQEQKLATENARHDQSMLFDAAKLVAAQFKGKVLKPEDPNFARLNRAQAIINSHLTPPGRAELRASDTAPAAVPAPSAVPGPLSNSRYFVK